MGEFYVQYPDITEVPYLHYDKMIPIFQDKEIKTEFVFWLQALEDPMKMEFADDLGLKPVAAMNNWWPSHAGQERKLTLWWKHLPEKENIKPGKLRRWCHGEPIYDPNFMQVKFQGSFQSKSGVITQALAGSGCGFKLIDKQFLEDADYKCDLRGRSFYRFFTLIRMPLKLDKKDTKFMKDYNYHLLDTGKLATYWVNGWDPKKYSIQEEYKFFKTSQEKWRQDEDNY